MNMTGQPTSSLSATAKTALAIWLAQSPPAPGSASADNLMICARLARAVQRPAGRPTNREAA